MHYPKEIIINFFSLYRLSRWSSEIEALRIKGSSENIDIPQIKINGTWGGICDDGFTKNEADVICKQLG